MSLSEAFLVNGYHPKDPTARCDACGVLGTVGRALRFQDGHEVVHARFCAACWIEESARLKARWSEEDFAACETARRSSIRSNPRPSMGSAFGAATWHGVRDFLWEHLLPSLQTEHAWTSAQLRAIADQYRAMAPEMVGVMPMIVEEFIAEHASAIVHVQADAPGAT